MIDTGASGQGVPGPYERLCMCTAYSTGSDLGHSARRCSKADVSPKAAASILTCETADEMLQPWWALILHCCAHAAAAAITVQDIRNVEALAAEPNVLDILARSLAPSIYGHFLIKKALVLLLLGGRCAHTGPKMAACSCCHHEKTSSPAAEVLVRGMSIMETMRKHQGKPWPVGCTCAET